MDRFEQNLSDSEKFQGQMGELRKGVKQERSLTKENKFYDTSGSWEVYDSALEEGPKSFQAEFGGLVPEGFSNLRTYLEANLKKQNGRAIGLEIAGSGSRLFADFAPGLFEKTAGFVLVDRRISEEEREQDAARHHEVIRTKDAFSSQGHRDVMRWLDGRKADLIIERMVANLRKFSENPAYLYSMLNRWYKLLNENGIILAVSPRIDETFNTLKIDDWFGKIKRRYKGMLDIATNIGEKETRSEGMLRLRLQKLQGAPSKLPG